MSEDKTFLTKRRSKATDGVAFQSADRAPRNPVEFEMVSEAEEKRFNRGRRRVIRRTVPKAKMVEIKQEDLRVIAGHEDNPVPNLPEGH